LTSATGLDATTATTTKTSSSLVGVYEAFADVQNARSGEKAPAKSTPAIGKKTRSSITPHGTVFGQIHSPQQSGSAIDKNAAA
jgi:hypothetical protein